MSPLRGSSPVRPGTNTITSCSETAWTPSSGLNFSTTICPRVKATTRRNLCIGERPLPSPTPWRPPRPSPTTCLMLVCGISSMDPRNGFVASVPKAMPDPSRNHAGAAVRIQSPPPPPKSPRRTPGRSRAGGAKRCPRGGGGNAASRTSTKATTSARCIRDSRGTSAGTTAVENGLTVTTKTARDTGGERVRMNPKLSPLCSPLPHPPTSTRPRMTRSGRGGRMRWRGTPDAHGATPSAPKRSPRTALVAPTP